MKTEIKKFYKLIFLLTIAIIMSFGGYSGVDLSLGYAFALSMCESVILSSLAVFVILLLNCNGLKLYACIAITLIFAILSYLLRLIKPNYRNFLKFIAVVLFITIKQLFLRFVLLEFGLSAISVLTSFYFSEKIFDKTFDYSLDSDFISVCVISFIIFLGLSEIRLFSTNVSYIAIPILICLSMRYFGREKGMLFSFVIALASYVSMKEESIVVSIAIFEITSYLVNGNASKLQPIILICEYIILHFFGGFFSNNGIISMLYFSIGALSVYLFPEKKVSELSFTVPLEQLVNETLKMSAKRLKELSATYKDVAKTLKEDSKIDNIPEKIIEECVRMCGYCKNKDKCKVFKKPNDSFEPLAITALSKGSINTLDVGEFIYSNCIAVERLINAVNTKIAKCNALAIKQKERADFNLTVKKIFSGLSDVLSYEAGNLDESHSFDRQAELDIYEELKLSGIKAKEVYCINNSSGIPTVKMKLDNEPSNIKTVSKIVSKSCGIKMKAQKDKKSGVITFTPKPEYEVETGIAVMSKGGEKVKSGDNFITDKLSDYSYLLAISDGMGTGKIANEASERTVNVIESLFKAGFSQEVICPMLNSVLMITEKESFSATDIVVIDTINLSAAIIKLGSPPTFLIKEKVVEISGHSLPVGIIEDVNPDNKKVEMKIGDMLVLMSDGVYDALKEKSAFYIDKKKSLSPQELCNYLLSCAIEENGGEILDDMTVLAAKIV